MATARTPKPAPDLAEENKRLRNALEESVFLQSHYAELLNMRDGGTRRRSRPSRSG
jgi:hypothetical protein